LVFDVLIFVVLTIPRKFETDHLAKQKAVILIRKWVLRLLSVSSHPFVWLL